jgi:hypothetical protein
MYFKRLTHSIYKSLQWNTLLKLDICAFPTCLIPYMKELMTELVTMFKDLFICHFEQDLAGPFIRGNLFQPGKASKARSL